MVLGGQLSYYVALAEGEVYLSTPSCATLARGYPHISPIGLLVQHLKIIFRHNGIINLCRFRIKKNERCRRFRNTEKYTWRKTKKTGEKTAVICFVYFQVFCSRTTRCVRSDYRTPIVGLQDTYSPTIGCLFLHKIRIEKRTNEVLKKITAKSGRRNGISSRFLY